MAQPMKYLFNISKSHFNTWASLRCMSKFNKDLVKATSSAATNQDLLLQGMKNAATPTEILDYVGKHHSVMNNKHLMQALRSLFVLQKQDKSAISTLQILRNPNFEKLCRELKVHAPAIEMRDVLEALKVVCFVGVSSNSTIVQVLLQIIRHKINDLSLQQIQFLDFLLHQIKPSPLSEALKIALPIVYEIQLPTKMSRDKIEYIAEYLQYVSKRSVSENCIELIIATAIKCKDEMSPETAKSLIWSICDLEPDTFFEPLMKRAFETLMLNAEYFNYQDIETTISKLISRYSSKHPFYYNEVFFDACGNYITERDLGFDMAVYTLRKFVKIGHAHDKLVDYAVKKCVEYPDLILLGDALLVYTLVNSIAMTDYRPVRFNSLKDLLIKTNVFRDCTKKEIIWLKLATSLTSLGVYKPEVYEKTFDNKNLSLISKKYFIPDYENLLLVNRALNLFRPDLRYLLPSSSFMENVTMKLRPIADFPMEGALKKCLGGEEYVKTNVKSKIGLNFDHLIVLRNGIPMPINNKEEELEKMNIPSNSQMVAVLVLRPFHYTINGANRLQRTMFFFIELLQAEELTVVNINLERWQSLLDSEKVAYLAQKINEKCQSNIELSNCF